MLERNVIAIHKISKILPYIIINLTLGFAGCFAFVFFSSEHESLLPLFIFWWKVRKSILLFIFCFPFIYVTALLLGYSLIFGKYGPSDMQRKSPVMARFIRSFFVLSIAVLFIYILLCEVVQPLLFEKQKEVLSQTITYEEYVNLAKESYDRNEFLHAQDHIKRALYIFPHSENALSLNEKIRVAFEKLSFEKRTPFVKDSNEESVLLLTAKKALLRAQKAMLVFDFYTAHYYAKLAYNIFEKDNPLRTDAAFLAEYSWEAIKKGTAEYNDASHITLYRDKKTAYEQLKNGNYINAYYSFLQIADYIKKLDEDKKDPEMERFFSMALAEVKKNVFFIDELEHIPNFDMEGKIFFTVALNKNEYLEIHIRGISHVTDNGVPEIYLLNVECSCFELNHERLWSMYIPYAKIIENPDNANSIRLQVRSLYRTIYGNDVKPQILFGAIPEEYLYNINLPMTINDFTLIERASKGTSSMKLSDIYYFSKIAEIFGLKKEAYLSAVLHRLIEPLVLLIGSLAAVILAWRFRLEPNRKFKKRWFLIFPICSFFSYVLMELIRYMCKLSIAFFVYLTPGYVALIVFGLPIAAFIILTISLFYQRSE